MSNTKHAIYDEVEFENVVSVMELSSESIDQKIGMLAMLDTITKHWDIRESDDDFADTLKMFKQNLIQWLEETA